MDDIISYVGFLFYKLPRNDILTILKHILNKETFATSTGAYVTPTKRRQLNPMTFSDNKAHANRTIQHMSQELYRLGTAGLQKDGRILRIPNNEKYNPTNYDDEEEEVKGGMKPSALRQKRNGYFNPQI